MADLSPPTEIARIVKSRQTYKLQMVIVTCDAHDRCWYEGRPGIAFDTVGIIRYLRDNWPTKEGRRVQVMFACASPMKALIDLERQFREDPEWNVRIRISEGEREEDDGCTYFKAERQHLVYFGFRDQHRHTRYLYVLDPLEFMDRLSDYGEKDDTELVRLYRFAGNIRRFCKSNGLRFAATKGGISAQLLRDSRFYPDDRRKVPRLTNETARPALPGNCYQMTEYNTQRYFNSVYIIDQQNAHHWAAEHVALPHADRLFAYGWYWDVDDEAQSAPWLDARDPLFEEVMNEYGLFRVVATVPQKLSGYLPPWARIQKGHSNGGSIIGSIWLFSNELAFAEALGVQIRHISRWYTSSDVDGGLRRYAQWAQDAVARSEHERTWLKPTLLSAYGILGARPRHIESAYKRSPKGHDHTYILAGHPFTYRQVRTERKLQSPIANVIQRGMIEAETRKLSIELARRLDSEGHNVIGIHADAILVEDIGQQLPLLPPPWRVKDCLTRFKALDAVSFQSDEMEILPGRPRKRRQDKEQSKNGNVRQRQGIRA